jgi:hypothetical protein
VAEGVLASGGPEVLLRGALEKIVFFECRLSQLEAELAAAQTVAAREKEAAAGVRTREVELETLLAKLRGALATAGSRGAELEDRVRLLEAERERFLTGLVDRARVAGAPGEGEGEAAGEQADLAGFIAELRSEIDRLKPWKAAAEKAGITVDDGGSVAVGEPVGPASSVSGLAARFQEAGRLGLAPREAERMKERLPTRAERSLYETSMDDLASADPACRRRAADCLRALGSRTAAPLVAAAIGRERDPAVKAALLSALAAFGEPATADLALRESQDPRPVVRAAALEALASLAKDRAEPALAGALNDPSPMVRRRAVLLLGFIPGSNASDALASMLADRDSGVARAAAVALAGRPSTRAQGALARALDHREPTVRRCAAEAVARWSGEEVDPSSSAAERRRAARRIAEKLAGVEESALREAVVRAPATAARRAAAPPRPTRTPVSPATATPAPRSTPVATPIAAPSAAVPAAAATAARTAVAVVESPAGEPGPLETMLIDEVRASLRGRSVEELMQVTEAEPAAVAATLRTLVARGTLSQRGPRFFMS